MHMKTAYKGAMSSQTSNHSDQHNLQREVATQKAAIPATANDKETARSSSSSTPVREQSTTAIDDRLKDPPPARETFLASLCRAIGRSHLTQWLHDSNTVPAEVCDTSTVNLSKKENRATPSSSKQDKSTAKAESPQNAALSHCHGKENHKVQVKHRYSLRERLKGVWKTTLPNTELVLLLYASYRALKLQALFANIQQKMR
ncbi:uncharacterized protein N7483_005595 [Penicillium malachiteum]|uniref:uncharacterized protein n=1 Tax=Penicillium malachiteum TaxID=1324776 RepID=UPI002547833E|nr:uncharacterized protein N7483_005595 [Penicillium malachiteum]KAJ5731087.1 hypothetical protein N7483_005595 [Penicillium malachiteum]